MTMVSPEERISRLEGVIEQINERQGSLERMLEERTSTIISMLDHKADKTEMRLMFVITLTLMAVLFSAVFGLLGVVLTRI